MVFINIVCKKGVTFVSKQCLDLFKKDSTDFVRQFVTMDETYHRTPKTKQQSKLWVEADAVARHQKDELNFIY